MKNFLMITAAAVVSCMLPYQAVAQIDDCELEHECTSWMVFADLTKNNTNILHKNRDSKYRNIAAYLSPADSPRKWVALGNNASSNLAVDGSANMVINTSGLAGVMNSGEKCIHHSGDQSKKCTPAVMRAVIESCDTAAQAVDKLRELINDGDYSHGDKGSIFFFCDRNEGYICEITAKKVSAVRYDKGYTVRANVWLNPGMQQLARNTLKAYLNSGNRMYMTMFVLNQALDKSGKITLLDIFSTSRTHKLTDEVADKRSVCYNYTNSAASLEIDRQYPDVLSTAYMAIGHPLHTVFVPIPVCAEKLHPAMSDLKWSKASWERFDKLKLQDIPAEWTRFENNYMAKFIAAKVQARKLLDRGKRVEAVKLVNNVAAGIWDEAASLLKL